MNTKIKVYTPKEAFIECTINDAVLLDVREVSMIGSKNIDVPKRIHISAKELDDQWIILPLNKHLIVADSSDTFARTTAEFLFDQGLNIAVLEGGLLAWEQEEICLIENDFGSHNGSCLCKNKVNENF